MLAEQERRQERFVNSVTASIAESLNVFSTNLAENFQRLSDKLDDKRQESNTENSVPKNTPDHDENSENAENYATEANTADPMNMSDVVDCSELWDLIRCQKRRIKEGQCKYSCVRKRGQLFKSPCRASTSNKQKEQTSGSS